ncbi:DegT/DnrJ/EryC1/StrS family aminotransferase, partial [Pelagibacteraceae bacterium]|nr:DegT/DnrJ/EryC1/StrS family aminotransferase [Pelagibacteraceae bacterium]
NKVFTYNIITKKIIKAIIVVHCFGNLADMLEIKKILKNKNIKIIEDAAESFGSYMKLKTKKIFAGTIGDIGCLSFNGNKIITSGGGGMILSNNKKIYEKSMYLATQAKDDSLKYIHNQVGYNYKMNNIQAAVGLAQLENINEFIAKKKTINLFYKKYINNNTFKFYINENPNYNKFFSINWLNILRFDNKKITSQKIIDNLKKHNIESRYVWLPNHLQKPYLNNQKFHIKHAIQLFSSSVCLPSSYSLNKSKIIKIANILNKL